MGGSGGARAGRSHLHTWMLPSPPQCRVIVTLHTKDGPHFLTTQLQQELFTLPTQERFERQHGMHGIASPMQASPRGGVHVMFGGFGPGLGHTQIT